MADDNEADGNEDEQTQYGGTEDEEPTTDLDEDDEEPEPDTTE